MSHLPPLDLHWQLFGLERQAAPAGPGVSDKTATAISQLYQRCQTDGRTPDPEPLLDQIRASGACGILALQAGQPVFFLLARQAGPTADIIEIGCDPDWRRQGIAHAGLARFCSHFASHQPSGEIFLEVAADNQPAIGLYQRAGFVRAGLRRGYYSRSGAAVDALVFGWQAAMIES